MSEQQECPECAKLRRELDKAREQNEYLAATVRRWRPSTTSRAARQERSQAMSDNLMPERIGQTTRDTRILQLETENAKLREQLQAALEALAEQQSITVEWQQAAKMDQVLINLKRAETAEAENAALRKALAWYADKRVYQRKWVSAKVAGLSSKADIDGGQRGG